jgi:transcriptional regulator with XRE-family HTH domain
MTTRTPVDKRLSRNLRFLKRRDGLRFVDIAEHVGTTPRQVQDWTIDADWGSKPNDENLLKLADLFGVDFSFFFQDNEASRGA